MARGNDLLHPAAPASGTVKAVGTCLIVIAWGVSIFTLGYASGFNRGVHNGHADIRVFNHPEHGMAVQVNRLHFIDETHGGAELITAETTEDGLTCVGGVIGWLLLQNIIYEDRLTPKEGV